MSDLTSYDILREQMVDEQLVPRGIRDARVLEAMRRIPRHLFIPERVRPAAYRDGALPIGRKQTISQPYVVALMTQLLSLSGHERVLEIGTGSGYQTAVLCELASEVISLERHNFLAGRAGNILESLGYDNIELHVGDGSQGLPDMAPFDAILVTAAAPALPGPLRLQMNSLGGRMVIPIGNSTAQHLEVITRDGNSWRMDQTIPVRFVPLIGEHGFLNDPTEKKKDDEQ